MPPEARNLLGGLVAAGLAYAGNEAALRAVQGGAAARWLRTNHGGRPVSLTEGPVAVAAVLGGALVAGSARVPVTGLATAVIGSGLVGVYDDLYGEAQAKGLRGHYRALREGRVTSGMVKVVGVGLSALLAGAMLTRSGPTTRRGPTRGGPTRDGLTRGRFAGCVRVTDLVLDGALIAGAANLTNLFDLRPGRAAKVVVVAGAMLWGPGSAPVLGAALGSLPADLGERSMLGDCGANALGAAVGVVAAAGLPRVARAALLATIATMTLISERVSFTSVIERNPVLRRVDGLGRHTDVADPAE
jgi:UDP-GlcNAc:undecaprenyl-phosphate GlcNAc-1-phosphate transferase